jgi:hypothetical protein
MAQGFNRNQFKTTPLSALKDQEKKHEAIRPSNSSGGGFERLSIEDGKNIFRLFPAHPEGGGISYMEPYSFTYLPIKVPMYDEGKVVEGEFEIKRKEVFNAMVHGGLSMDPCNEYLSFVKDNVLPNLEKSKGSEMWKVCTGMKGVKTIDNWAVYANKCTNPEAEPSKRTWKFGLLLLKKSMHSQMLELAAEITALGPDNPDPYSDVTEGIAIVIEKSGKMLDTKYKINLDKVQVDRFNTSLIPTELDNTELELFLSKRPLFKRFVNSYTQKDLEKQIEGLRRFDTDNKVDAFNDSRFEEILNKIATESLSLPEDNVKEKPEKAIITENGTTTHKPVIKQPAADTGYASTIPKQEPEELPWEGEERDESPVVNEVPKQESEMSPLERIKANAGIK